MSADRPDAYVVRPGEAEIRRMGGTSTEFLATGASTGDLFCLVDERAAEGDAVPLHRHPADVESFYVLEGEITFHLAGRPGATVPAGGFVHIPAGIVHGFRVVSPGARYLILTTPRHGEFYRAITVASDGERRPKEKAPMSVSEACRTFGIEFVGPLPPS